MTTQSESNLDKQISEVICLQCLIGRQTCMAAYQIQDR